MNSRQPLSKRAAALPLPTFPDARGGALARADPWAGKAPALGPLRTLLDTVKATLRGSLDAQSHALQPQESNPAGRTHLSAPECIEVIDQLYVLLKHELARQSLLEQEVCAAQAALLKTRAELMGAQVTARQAHRRALHDELTALPNRGFFRDRLDQALRVAVPQRRALAVLYLDLDGFKAVNDLHGHDVGDELLRVIASRLTRAVRTEDVVSRLGGDEFACLLAGSPSRKQLAQLAGKLVAAIAAPCKLGVLKLSVSASIGIAVCPSDGETVDALLKNADAAMYYAKRRGNCLAFFDQGVGG